MITERGVRGPRPRRSRLRVPDADRLLGRDGQVPGRLPGAHRRLRLRDRHRRGPLRATPTASRAPPTRSRRSAAGSAARRARRTAGAATLDAPVSIRALKRFVTEQFGPETGDYAAYRDGCRRAHAAARPRRLRAGRGGRRRRLRADRGPRPGPRSATRSRCSRPTAEPGGMLTVGVPVFRLPRELVRHEIQAILSLGVELQLQHAARPRFHHRRPAARRASRRSSSASACPRAASCDMPGRRAAEASTTAWSSCSAFNEGTAAAAGPARSS